MLKSAVLMASEVHQSPPPCLHSVMTRVNSDRALLVFDFVSVSISVSISVSVCLCLCLSVQRADGINKMGVGNQV